MNKYICPQCGADVTEAVHARAAELEAAYYRKLGRMGGAASGKKNGPVNIAKANAMYTPEKRKAAALKAWETKRKKAAENAEK